MGLKVLLCGYLYCSELLLTEQSLVLMGLKVLLCGYLYYPELLLTEQSLVLRQECFADPIAQIITLEQS